MRKKISNVKKDSAVARLVNDRINNYYPNTPQIEIAESCGYAIANNITMLKQGTSKVPLDKAVRLAEKIGIEPRRFVLMCIEEYLPAVAGALDDVDLIPHNEFEAALVASLLKNVRETGTKRTLSADALNEELGQFIRSNLLAK